MPPGLPAFPRVSLRDEQIAQYQLTLAEIAVRQHLHADTKERVGLNGAVFTLFKLRSMRVDAEAAGISVGC